MRARFHIDAVFTVEGRGTVLQGTIVDGEIAPGIRVIVPGLGWRPVIRCVDAIHGPTIPIGSLGLVLREDARGTPDELRPFTEGKTLDVEQTITEQIAGDEPPLGVSFLTVLDL